MQLPVWIKRLILIAVGLPALIVVGSVGSLALDDLWQGILARRESPQARFVRSMERSTLNKVTPGLFHDFNHGDWKHLCLIGPYAGVLDRFDRNFPEARRGWASWRARVAGPFLSFEKGGTALIFVDGQVSSMT